MKSYTQPQVDILLEALEKICAQTIAPVYAEQRPRFIAREALTDFAKASEKKEAIECIHPGCCCVCGHKGLCPEDGPSIVQGVVD